MYLNEQKVTLDQAAILADEFVLTHRISFVGQTFHNRGSGLLHKSQFSKQMSVSASASKESSAPSSERLCFYCKKPGHVIADCTILRKKEQSAKPDAFVKTSGGEHMMPPVDGLCDKVEAVGSSLLMDGFVSKL